MASSRLRPVILITVDALRADHLGCYGYKRSTSPAIDRMAKEGVRFDDALSGATFTHPSVAGLMSSRFIKHNMFHVRDCILEISGDPFTGIPILPEVLAGHGYRTAFFGPYVLSFMRLFRRGFGRVSGCSVYLSKNFIKVFRTTFPALKRFGLGLYGFVLDFLIRHSNESADVLTRRAIHWMKKNRQKPFFLWLHYFDVHSPWRPPKPFDSLFSDDGIYRTGRNLPIKSGEGWREGGIPDFVAEDGITDLDHYISRYDGSIAFVDRQIGVLTEALRKLGLEEQALVIFTSDHGTPLGESDLFSHSSVFPCEPVIKVPLVIKQKGVFESGVVSSQAQSVDIAATILDVLGLDQPPTMQGESLVPRMPPKRGLEARYAFFGGEEISVIRGDGYKLLRLTAGAMKTKRVAACEMFKDPFYDETGDALFLFRPGDDPQEQVNLMAREPEKGRELLLKLKEWLKAGGREFGNKRTKADTATIERLRSLGYV